MPAFDKWKYSSLASTFALTSWIYQDRLIDICGVMQGIKVSRPEAWYLYDLEWRGSVYRESHHSLQHWHCDITTHRCSNAHNSACFQNSQAFMDRSRISNREKSDLNQNFCSTLETCCTQMWHRLFSPIFPGALGADNGTQVLEVQRAPRTRG